MISELLPRIIILASILLVGLPIVFGVISWLWNSKYVPARLAKGKLVKPFGKIASEVNSYVFKEDKATLAKKGSPLAQKLLSLKSLHILGLTAGSLAYIFTGNFLFLIVFPISFIFGISRALPVMKKRDKILGRIFAIASNTIKFSSGPRGKNASHPAFWNFITVEEWISDEDPKKMVITFPAGQGPDKNAQNAFDKTFTENVTDEHDWNPVWDLTHDKVTIEAVDKLPTELKYPGSSKYSWSEFPVGLAKSGIVSFDLKTFPHVLVGGPSGTGKSVLQRNIVFHTIQHNDRWRFLGVDLKRVELTPYNKYKQTVMGIATEVDQGLEVLKYAYNAMMDRYKMMEEKGQNNLMDLEDPPYCILLMVDEATMFLGASGSKTDEGKAEDMMKAEASDLVGKILRLGRAAGIHMVVAMQRPDAVVLRGEFKANMDVRLAAGRMDSTPSSMILDSGEAVNLPGIRGRGLLRVGGSLETFQGYFALPTWIDEFILENPHVEPTCVAPGGHLYERYQEKLAAKTSEVEEAAETLETSAKKAPKADKKPRKARLGKKPLKEEPSEQEQEIVPEVVASAPSIAKAEIEEAPRSYPEPDFMNQVPVEEVDANHQSLIDALSKRPEDTVVDVDDRTVPAFFNGLPNGNEEPVHTPVNKPTIEPDLDLKPEDFILDDFDDMDDLDEEIREEVSPLPVKEEPVEAAPPALLWESASPFDSKPAPAKTVSKPVAKPAPVAEPEPAETAQEAPVRPVRPVSPFAFPTKPAGAASSKPVVSPFQNQDGKKETNFPKQGSPFGS